MILSNVIDDALLIHVECDLMRLHDKKYVETYAAQFSPFSLLYISNYSKFRIAEFSDLNESFEFYEKCRAASWQASYVSTFISDEI